MKIFTGPRAGLLIGHQAISGFLNLDPQHAARLVRTQGFPAFEVGHGFFCARRETLAALQIDGTGPAQTLNGRDEIRAYVGATSAQLNQLLAAGLPYRAGERNLTASCADIDQWISEREADRGHRQ